MFQSAQSDENVYDSGHPYSWYFVTYLSCVFENAKIGIAARFVADVHKCLRQTKNQRQNPSNCQHVVLLNAPMGSVRNFQRVANGLEKK